MTKSRKELETGAFSPIKVYIKVKRKDAVFAEHTIQRCLFKIEYSEGKGMDLQGKSDNISFEYLSEPAKSQYVTVEY